MSRGPGAPSAPQPSSSRSTLRINTDPHTRFRSNSATSGLPSPRLHGLTPMSGVEGHHVSRSMSHAPSPTGAERMDVAAAVQGLRSGMSSHDGVQGDTDRPSPSRLDTGTGSMRFEGGGLRVVEESPVSRSGADGAIAKIQRALEKSPDGGETVDLSRRGFEGIGDEEIEYLKTAVTKGGVWRLALSYNALRDRSLASSFSQLSRLRYLNLKGNQFSYFPEPLTDMPSLEILDLSKNRITSFPVEPGRLVKLKVLSLTYNNICTLPDYMVRFDNLKVFKLGQNPIEWPPREVLGAMVELEVADDGEKAAGGKKKEEDLRPWIQNMKSWMRQRASEADRLLTRSKADEDAYMASEEEPVSAVSTNMSERSWAQVPAPVMRTQSSQATVKRLPPLSIQQEQWSSRPISPSVSRFPLGQRNRSATFSDESLLQTSSPTSMRPPNIFGHDRNASVSSASTPPISATTASSSHSRNPSFTQLGAPPPAIPGAAGHNRGASYTVTQRMSGQLTAKKSLPDLRQSHAKIIQDRRNDAPLPETRALGLGIAGPGMARFQSQTKPLFLIGEDMVRTSSAESEKARLLNHKRSADMLKRGSGDIVADLVAERRNSQEGPLADESRNSYFRRMSMLPTSTLSKAIPPVLLRFIDAVRGILFALSQLHSALRQYLLFAVNERVAGMFARVMDPASTYMTNLINALDRFDSMSRRATPPVHAIRGVITAAKDSVAVSAKIVAVLKLQMSDLRNNDVRYTRTLLLMAYGSLAEVARSWTAMAPLLAEMRPLLAVGSGAVAARALMGGHKMVPTGSLTGRTPISPIPEKGETYSPSNGRTASTTPNAQPKEVTTVPTAPIPSIDGRSAARSRRQGGSFSTQDVERGMLMHSPSAHETETSSGYVRHRPSASAQVVLDETTETDEDDHEEELSSQPPVRPFGHAASSSVPLTPPELAQPEPVVVLPNAPQRNHAHTKSTSSESSQALHVLSGPMRKLSVDIRPPTPTTAATLFDDDLLDVLENATDIAFTVWLRLAEEIGASSPPVATNQNGTVGHFKSSSSSSVLSTLDSARTGAFANRRPATVSSRHHAELVSLLSAAEQVTSALRESLAGIRANPLTTYAHTTLPEDGQTFIKTVVRVSELVKAISATHTFPLGVRQACSKLTQATRECAILMQVSSLGPRRGGAYRPGTSASTTYGSRGQSSDDLPLSSATMPQSAVYPTSAGWAGSGVAEPVKREGSGLRGLHLPAKMSLGRSRSANPVPLAGSGGMDKPSFGRSESSGVNGGPRSAQASQVAF